MRPKTSVSETTAPPSRRKGVLIIDDHAIVRQGLAYLINQEKDLFVAGQEGDAQLGLEAVEKLKPDIVLLDISLPGMNGIEFLNNLRAHRRDLPVLVLSTHDESLYAERALRAGAMGYIMKKASAHEVIAGLRKGLRGEFQVSSRMSATIFQKALHKGAASGHSTVSILTDREREVFELLGRGIGTRQIAGILHVSVKTIDSHRAHIKKKLHLKNSAELMQHAVRYVEEQKIA